MQLTPEAFNMSGAIRLHRLQPHCILPEIHHVICGQCRYINSCGYNFCTNCGHPLTQNRELHTLYMMRVRQRKELLLECETTIQLARNTLYILAAVSITGIGLGFSELDERILLSLASVILSGLYFLLAKWSYRSPFTALLVSVMFSVTFSVIALLGRIKASFTTVTGVYGLLITIVVLYLLLRGLAFAFKADLVKEEMEIV